MLINEILEFYRSGEKFLQRSKLAIKKELVEKVNNTLEKIPTNTITKTNNLINAMCILVAKKLGIKKGKEGSRKEP